MSVDIVVALIGAASSIVVAIVSLSKSRSTEHKVAKQKDELRDVTETQLMLAALVTGAEAEHLHSLVNAKDLTYNNHKGVRDELRSLIGRGLLRKRQPGEVHQLPPHFVLGREFEITALGRQLLDFRKKHRIEDVVLHSE